MGDCESVWVWECAVVCMCSCPMFVCGLWLSVDCVPATGVDSWLCLRFAVILQALS